MLTIDYFLISEKNKSSFLSFMVIIAIRSSSFRPRLFLIARQCIEAVVIEIIQTLHSYQLCAYHDIHVMFIFQFFKRKSNGENSTASFLLLALRQPEHTKF